MLRLLLLFVVVCCLLVPIDALDSISIPEPIPRNGAAFQNITKRFRNSTRAWKHLVYQVFSPRYWTVSIPYDTPPGLDDAVGILYSIHNVSYHDRDTVGIPYHLSVYKVDAHGECNMLGVIHNHNNQPSMDQTHYTGQIQGQHTYIGDNIPCYDMDMDMPQVQQHFCRAWLTNTTSYNDGVVTRISYRIHYFVNTGYEEIGIPSSFQYGYYNEQGSMVVEESGHVLNAQFYSQNQLQAAKQDWNNDIYTLPQTCQALTQDGIVDAFDKDNTASSTGNNTPASSSSSSTGTSTNSNTASSGETSSSSSSSSSPGGLASNNGAPSLSMAMAMVNVAVMVTIML